MEIPVVGIVDCNTPWAKCNNKVTDLANAISVINNENPERNTVIAFMPDIPKSTSANGLHDEVKNIVDSLLAVKQHGQNEFIELYSRHKKADAKKFGKTWGIGVGNPGQCTTPGPALI